MPLSVFWYLFAARLRLFPWWVVRRPVRAFPYLIAAALFVFLAVQAPAAGCRFTVVVVPGTHAHLACARGDGHGT